MRRVLDGSPIPAPEWPAGIRPVAFDPAIHPMPAHRLLVQAYAKGGGSVGAFDNWWNALRTDDEYDPNLCFVAVAETDRAVVGFAQCWSSAFVKDIAVSPRFRRQGMGRALLLEVFRAFRGRGAGSVDLKVEANNPSGAVRFYQAMGMVVVGEEKTT
ncbi:MAG TPA: N-acetyltransferase [Azospirillaceae bacterium]|nr:N-acetyltransferase [Azospirillaceae bacterium]